MKLAQYPIVRDRTKEQRPGIEPERYPSLFAVATHAVVTRRARILLRPTREANPPFGRAKPPARHSPRRARSQPETLTCMPSVPPIHALRRPTPSVTMFNPQFCCCGTSPPFQAAMLG